MRNIAIVIALCVGAWYYFIGGRKLDEPMVHRYYEQEAHAILSRDPERLCKQLSSRAVVQDRTTLLGKSQDNTMNRAQACSAARDSFKNFAAIGEAMGGILTIEYDYHLDSVELASDRKSAIVKGTSRLKMGEQALQFVSSFEQRIERELGQVRLVRSDQSTLVRMQGAGAMRQSDFFKQ